jgi:hypothetical protein
LKYAKESQMYPDIAKWLQSYLTQRYVGWQIHTQVCATQRLNKVIQAIGIQSRLPQEYQTWDVQADIVGVVSSSTEVALVLVECKNKPITLGHLSQMIGYCKVVKPIIGLMLSPAGVSPPLCKLIQVFGRTDILVYDSPARRAKRKIVFARWDAEAKSLDAASVIPAGEL